MSRSEDLHSIESATAALLRAVNAADVDGVLDVWAEDGVLMPPNHAAVHGRAAIEAYFRQLFQRASFKFEFTGSDIVLHRDIAIQRLTYTAEVWTGEATIGTRDRGKGVHVYSRQAGDAWKLQFDIWNSDVPRRA